MVRQSNLNPTHVTRVDETSSHNKCKYTENEEKKFQLFQSCHIDEDGNKGATDESKK